MSIKGESVISYDKLKTLLLFGDNPALFEKEIIRGFHDNYINGETYNFHKEEVEVLTEEPIGDGEYNTIIETTTYPKNELIEYAIDVETYRSIAFLESNYYKIDDYSHHQWLFARILKCYLSSFEVSIVDYPYRDYYIEYFTEILKKSLSLYCEIFGDQFNLKEVKKKLKSDIRLNETGFKLKPLIYGTKIKLFTDQLVKEGYIEAKDIDKFKQFLLGEYPNPHIEWKEELRYLVYFIQKLVEKKDNSPTFLIDPPGQEWKNLSSIFTFKQSRLPEKINVNFSKLGRKFKRRVDSIFDLLKI